MNNYRYGGNSGVGGGGSVGGGQVEDRFRDSSIDAGREGYFYGRDSPMMTNDTSRRLFFSPAYFDPELLKVYTVYRL